MLKESIKHNDRLIKTVVFCGGHGGVNIYRKLLDHPNFDVTVVVNAYDDGLSTGDIRRAIPGFLGPSDVRKNIVAMVDHKSETSRIVCELFSLRLPARLTEEQEKDFHEAAIIGDWTKINFPEFRVLLTKLNQKKRDELIDYLRVAISFLFSDEAKYQTILEDCSFGNLILSGIFLANNKDFDLMVEVASKLAEIKGTLLCVSPQNLWLVGVAANGEFLSSEAAIVNNKSNVRMAEVFLLNEEADSELIERLSEKDLQKNLESLKNIENLPKANRRTLDAISYADLIILCPGTQHSSLYPTYLAEGLPEALMMNKHAMRVIITNVGEDKEIPMMTANDIINSALLYLNGKGNRDEPITSYIDYFFVNDPFSAVNSHDMKYVEFKNDIYPGGEENLILRNLEDPDHPGKHDGTVYP
jgi:2-phospho-L-lactate transferase/gluconeogenesis factor (CofD/UPF0052 family)